MTHDVSHVSADDLPALNDKKADLLRRRENATAYAAQAGADVLAAKDKLNDLAAAVASGKVTAPAVGEASAALRDAEGNVALAQNSLSILDAEQSQIDAEIAQAIKLKAIADHQALVAEAKSKAIKLDEAADAFNKAYDAWKVAHLAASHRPSLGPEFPGGPGLYTFQPGGAGVHGSLSLHPEVVTDLARLVGAPPARRRVASIPA